MHPVVVVAVVVVVDVAIAGIVVDVVVAAAVDLLFDIREFVYYYSKAGLLYLLHGIYFFKSIILDVLYMLLQLSHFCFQ